MTSKIISFSFAAMLALSTIAPAHAVSSSMGKFSTPGGFGGSVGGTGGTTGGTGGTTGGTGGTTAFPGGRGQTQPANCVGPFVGMTSRYATHLPTENECKIQKESIAYLTCLYKGYPEACSTGTPTTVTDAKGNKFCNLPVYCLSGKGTQR